MLKKIRVDDLRLGMHIHEFCGSWMEHPFWRENFILNNADDVHRIAESGISEVWIDVSKGVDVLASVPATSVAEIEDKVSEALIAAAGQGRPPTQVPMAEEVKRAARVCAKSHDAVVSMFQEARMGKAIDADAAGEMVDEISSSVMRNPGALISLARLKDADNYTYMHSVAVCALMVALSRQLGLDESETRTAGMAGLLHDLGKALTPNEILNKPGKLTDEEFVVMKQHPVEGHRLLAEAQAVGDVILDVCLHHHEKMDGSGYPDRRSGEEISIFARMGAVCDVYDAITSNRPYKSGWDPAESIRKMAEWSKGHFDERVFQAFVRSIGIYPVGSFIRLESGRLGVVTEQTAKSLLTPMVKVFFSTRSQTHIKPEIVDLGRPGTVDRIVSREDPAKWGIKDVDHYWMA
ncbi:MAG: HD-GYP domain-containing protein [Gammaproteobacteria bacterium]|nr:HD-GYP domain-containing protein [Gammaproteobacteria bacterium]MBU1414539.1 HD-GYP domain-containing protein [Gammaproteobacteria bacterium]